MGQIIFPTTLDWSLGDFSQVLNVGQYLRLEYLHETKGTAHDTLNANFSGVLYNELPCWDLSTQASWFVVTTGTINVIAYLLWNGSIGGGFLKDDLEVVRVDNSFAGDTIDDLTVVGNVQKYVPYNRFLYSITPNRAHYDGYRWYSTDYALRLCYVIAVDMSTELNSPLYEDVYRQRYKLSGYWRSPIIDMGPYIHVTSLSVTNYFVPAGGSVRIYFRASGSAPTTGSPTAFEDTSGNTLYYYPADAEWSASDWEEVPSGSEPSYKDRYIQMKLELNGA